MIVNVHEQRARSARFTIFEFRFPSRTASIFALGLCEKEAPRATFPVHEGAGSPLKLLCCVSRAFQSSSAVFERRNDMRGQESHPRSLSIESNPEKHVNAHHLSFFHKFCRVKACKSVKNRFSAIEREDSKGTKRGETAEPIDTRDPGRRCKTRRNAPPSTDIRIRFIFHFREGETSRGGMTSAVMSIRTLHISDFHPQRFGCGGPILGCRAPSTVTRSARGRHPHQLHQPIQVARQRTPPFHRPLPKTNRILTLHRPQELQRSRRKLVAGSAASAMLARIAPCCACFTTSAISGNELHVTLCFNSIPRFAVSSTTCEYTARPLPASPAGSCSAPPGQTAHSEPVQTARTNRTPSLQPSSVSGRADTHPRSAKFSASPPAENTTASSRYSRLPL